MRTARSRSVTIRDVAREAQVSIASVSRALNGLDSVTEATRDRVLGAAQRLRYVPDTTARMLSTPRTVTMGVVLPDLSVEFFSEIIRGGDAGVRERGLHLLVSTSHGDAEEAVSAIRSMRGRVDGLLLMSPHVDADLLADNLSDDLPMVLMNSLAGAGKHPAFQVDNYGGALAVTRHLAKGGRRVAHIGGPDGNHDSLERRRGYADAMAAAGAESMIFVGDFTEETGFRAGQAIVAMPNRPGAVFAANDVMAVGCMLALEEAGIAVPGQVAVAGFDDIPIARLVRPALTTVRTSIADLGRKALERLTRCIAGKDDGEALIEIMPAHLVVRDSSSMKAA